MARQWTSFTELSMLGECEKKWEFRYRRHISPPQSPQQRKGELLHGCADRFWQGGEWRGFLTEWSRANDITDLEDDLFWLMERYERHYGPDRDAGLIEVVATELELKAKLPRVGNVVLGYIDQIIRTPEDNKLWLLERKSMGDWQRLNYLSVDPQLTLYAWLVRENGWDIAGIAFDAIRTYRWKPEKPTQKQVIEDAEAQSAAWLRANPGGAVALPWELMGEWEYDGNTRLSPAKRRQAWAKLTVARHPGLERVDSDSFQWIYEDRSAEHIRAALDDAVGAVRRRQALRRGARPLRNLGRNCGNCWFKDDCFEELAFAPQLMIVED